LACAITTGALCARDAELANCIAVSAVVARSSRRKLVIWFWIPRVSRRLPINNQR
jgi:hypothetical protein